MIDKLPESIEFKYEIVKSLGEGSMGETWLIKNRVDKTQAALKRLKLNTVEDLKAVELFKREAQTLKEINVKGVPKFLDYLTDEDGNGYLIQEFIQAQSIEQFLDKDYIFPEEEALDIIRKLSDIVYELQAKYTPPIIHRDIKPSNILYNNRSHEVFLIDFGSVTHPEKKTGGSTVAGTFGYMPPEQMMNDSVIQSDYYAIGATLLHMITGVLPGNMKTDEMFHLDFIPVIKEKAPKTSKEVIKLLNRLLSREPEARAKNPTDFIVLLEQDLQKTNIFIRFYRYIRSLFSRTPNYSNEESANTQTKVQPKILSIDQDSDSDQDSQKSKIHHEEVPQRQSRDTYTEDDYLETVRAVANIITIQDTESSSDPDTHCTLVTHNWKKCHGTIQRQVVFTKRVFNNGNSDEEKTCALEYTFSVNGFTYIGRCFTPKQLIHCNYPMACQIIYDPKNPIRNALYSFDKQAFVKKIDQ